jgi:protein SCO1
VSFGEPANLRTTLVEEHAFAAQVDRLAQPPGDHRGLVDLMREDHAVYAERSAAAVVRMRGWVLLALARIGLADSALPFVLEELESGVDPYLVAAAARALRSYSTPSERFIPFVRSAVANISGRDEPLAFDQYGAYPTSPTGTTPISELNAVLAWIGAASEQAGPGTDDCCGPLAAAVRSVVAWPRRHFSTVVDEVGFEDQDGQRLTFREFFQGQPSFVVFFYTRCDNPLKCSLSLTKLARVQRLIENRGLATTVRTAAITYDPAFDLPLRLRAFAERRGVRLDGNHRVLRSPDDLSRLRRHFALGVNFIESLVNRHRIEAFVLDARGRIACSFERLGWDEHAVVEQLVNVLHEPVAKEPRAEKPIGWRVLGTVASAGLAFLPKCSMCWAAYLSSAGIVGLERLPLLPWLRPLLLASVAINVWSTWSRAAATRRFTPAVLTTAGALVLGLSIAGLVSAAAWAIVLMVAGSASSARSSLAGESTTRRVAWRVGQYSASAPVTQRDRSLC